MKLSIAQRLWCLVLFSIAIMVGVGIIGIHASYNVKDKLDTIREDLFPSVYTLNQITRTVINSRLAAATHVIADNPKDKAVQEKRLQELRKQLADLTDEYAQKYISDENDRKLLEEDKARFAVLWQKMDAVIAASNSGDTASTKVPLEELRNAAIAVNAAVTPHVKYNDDLVDRINKEAEQSIVMQQRVSITSIVLGALAILGLALWLVRKLTNSLNTMQRTVLHIDQSLDMTKRIPLDDNDELGATAQAFNKLLESLQRSLLAFSQGVKDVASASVKAAQSSRQLAQTSGDQSSAAANMAASIEELTVSINHVGDRAAQTNSRVAESGHLATDGEAIVQETVNDIQQIACIVEASAKRIGELESQSQKVDAVIKVIQEVADQTNLLALNAAIEAARAGELGRGFAVVADEVRKLAERTAASTKQITETIGTMRTGAQVASQDMHNAVEQVANSVSRAMRAETSIHAIGKSSRESVDMVSEIADAIREQSSASTAVAQTVERIAQMAEESASSAREGADSAHHLDSLAHRMQEEVARYTL